MFTKFLVNCISMIVNLINLTPYLSGNLQIHHVHLSISKKWNICYDNKKFKMIISEKEGQTLSIIYSHIPFFSSETIFTSMFTGFFLGYLHLVLVFLFIFFNKLLKNKNGNSNNNKYKRSYTSF
jgi:hypothetical protein